MGDSPTDFHVQSAPTDKFLQYGHPCTWWVTATLALDGLSTTIFILGAVGKKKMPEYGHTAIDLRSSC